MQCLEGPNEQMQLVKLERKEGKNKAPEIGVPRKGSWNFPIGWECTNKIWTNYLLFSILGYPIK